MKNYSKKVFSLLIAFLMVISLLPATVLADEPEAYSVYIGGTQVTSENLSGNGWAFSPDDNTLTLTNVNIGGAGGIAVSSDAKAGIYANGIDLTIVGTGSITGPMGICVENGSLTISGDAEAEAPTTVLTVESSAADDDAIYSAVSVTIENSKVTIPYAGDDGISSHEGDLTIENSILDITADYGLYSDESDTFIKNSTVDIDAYYGIYNDSTIAITDDSKVTITDSEYGLYTDYDITITDSEVNVTAEEYGIYSDYAEVVIENSTVNVNDCYYYGIRAYEDYDEDGVSLTIEGSEVTLTDCYGDYSVIYAYYDSIEISENSTVAIKQTDSEDSYGYAYYNIYAYYGGFAIKDSSLTVDNSYYYGVYADGSYNEDACILVDGSTVKLDYIMDYSGIGYVGLYADGGNAVIEDSTVIASNQEYGIWADYDIDIESSKVTAEGCEDYGIGASGAISISGATSRVSAGTDDYAVYAGDGFSLTDVTIVKPEGGAISESGKTIVDASGTTAAYVLIQGEGEVTYTVTFDANGHGTAPDPQTVEEGGRATRPANPTESGWRFGGWYLEAECVNAFDFSTPITGDITLYAKWTEAGTGGGTVVTKYTLTYETNGGSAIDPAEYRKGTTVELTETPVREGYTFTGWYSEPELINKITSIKMDEDKTVYAGWEESAPAGFTDVPEDAWYKEAVDYVAENGIMSGVGNNKFDPLGTTTRGMIVTILYGLEGKPAVSGSSPFDDVAEGQWYTDAVIWANANGIVAGYGNGKFGPTDNITREQFATILYVYAQYKGYDTAKAADLSGYADAADISAYAVNAMKWANAEGMITGRTATTLVPGGNATRAEAAAIFKQFTENVK